MATKRIQDIVICGATSAPNPLSVKAVARHGKRGLLLQLEDGRLCGAQLNHFHLPIAHTDADLLRALIKLGYTTRIDVRRWQKMREKRALMHEAAADRDDLRRIADRLHIQLTKRQLAQLERQES